MRDGFSWKQKASTYKINEEKNGYWVVADNWFAPFVVEVAPKLKYANYDEFQHAIVSTKCELAGNRVVYRSLTNDELSLPVDYKGLPTVNGCNVDITPTWGMNSPFVKSVFDSGIVKIEKDGRSMTLNFNRKL